MIDNYDSFTYNLVQYLGELGARGRRRRNDADHRSTRSSALRARAVVISPGPCTPREAGISMAVIERFAGTDADPRRVPRAPGDRRRLRRRDRARAAHHARQDVARSITTAVASSRGLPNPVRGDPLPLAGHRRGHAARRARGHRLDRRGRDHGRAPPRVLRSRACSSIPSRSSPPRASGSSRTSWRACRRRAAEPSDVAARRSHAWSTGDDLSEGDAGACVDAILAGEATPAQIAGFLVALRMKGETAAEIDRRGARAARARDARIARSPAARSTPAAPAATVPRPSTSRPPRRLVVAAAGVPVAKHGNRAVSGTAAAPTCWRRSGSSSTCRPPTLATLLADVGFAFLFAPRCHPALRHAAAVRRELGIRTIFNLLGPLTNPAGGAAPGDRRLRPPLARADGAGAGAARDASMRWVVHGADGLDELTLEGASAVAEVQGERVSVRTVSAASGGPARRATGCAPRVVGRRCRGARRGDPRRRGRPGDGTSCASTPAPRWSWRARPRNLRAGVARAGETIDAGAASALLARLVAFTTAAPGAGRHHDPRRHPRPEARGGRGAPRDGTARDAQASDRSTPSRGGASVPRWLPTRPRR